MDLTLLALKMVDNPRFVCPKPGTLLGLKLQQGGVLVAQKIAERVEYGFGQFVRIFDIIIDDAADVDNIPLEKFSEENVLISPMQILGFCFGPGDAIFIDLKRNIGVPEIGQVNILGRPEIYDPVSRGFIPYPEYGVEPDPGDYDRSEWPIHNYIFQGPVVRPTPLEERHHLLVPNSVYNILNIDLFVARALAYQKGLPLPTKPIHVDEQ